MSKNIPLPRLVDASGNTLRRINTLGVSIELTIVPLSYASMRLPAGESLPARGYVELYTVMGSAGIFRVRSPKDTYGSPEGSAELEHAIVEVGDYLVKHKYDEMMAASTAMTTIFSHYGGSKWQLGSVSAMGSSEIAVEANYDSVLVAMNALLDQVQDCMMSFDFSTHPWTVNIVKRDSTVSAEGRLSRNVNYANITYDDTELCTRAYYEVSLTDSETGETTSEWRYIDADTMGTYGLIEREVQTGSSFTEDEALSVATEYLNKHKHPKISIEINGYVLSRITGEPLDSFAIGKMFRLALPEYNTTVSENITGLSFSDVYGKPESVTVRLAEEEDSALTFLHDIDSKGESSVSSGGGGRGGGRKSDDKWKEYRTRFEMDDYHIALISEHLNRANEILQQAGMDIDSQTGVLIWHTDNENMAGAKFSVQATAIESLVTKTGINSLGTSETLYSKMTQNAEGITTLVGKTGIASLPTGETLYSKWSQSADDITGIVTKTGINNLGQNETLYSKWSQSADDITGIVTKTGINNLGQNETLYSKWSQSADDITGIVTKTGINNLGQNETLYSKWSQSADDITGIVTKTGINNLGQNETLYSKWSQSADDITGIVTKTGINNLGQNETLYSKWSQSADDITGLVAKTGINSLGQSETLIGKINVNADKVGMVVGTQNGLHYIKAAEITASINNAGEGVATIDADKVYIGNSKSTTVINGKLNASDLTANFLKAKIADIDAVTIQSLYTPSAQMNAIYYSAGLIPIHQGVWDVKVVQDGNNYKLQKYAYNGAGWEDVGTFSRATSLSGSWSGTTYTVTASPQGNTNTTSVSLDLTGSANIIGASVKHGNDVLDSKGAELEENVSDKKVYVKLTGGSGSTIAQISTSNTFNAGVAAGIPTGATLGSKITGTVYNVSIARGSYSAVASTIDVASAYTDARAGYYTAAQYATHYNEGRTTGATSLTISGASTSDATTKLMDGNYKWKVTATTTKGDGTSYTQAYVIESKHDMGIRQSKSGATMTVTAACQPDGSHDAATKSRDYTLEYSNGQAHIMYNGTSYADLTCGGGGGNYTKYYGPNGETTFNMYYMRNGSYLSAGSKNWYYKS